MKKILVIALAVVLTAGSVMALETNLKGFFDYRYRWVENPTGYQIDPDSYGRHDQDMRIQGQIKANDNSFANIRLAIHDEEWAAVNDGWSPTNRDADITVERAWLTHKFASGLTADIGLMPGGEWGTSFADTGVDVYRVKLSQTLPIGKVWAIYEKSSEQGAQNNGANDSEKNDVDRYYVLAYLKAGPVSLFPLFVWIDLGDASPVDYTWVGILAGKGKAGIIGYEFEAQYQSRVWEIAGVDDQSTFNLYGNVWANVGPATIGGLVAYMPIEDGFSRGAGEDFARTMLLIGSEYPFQPGDNLDEIDAGTLFEVYADIAVGDAMTITPAFAYIDGDNDLPLDTTAWEIDLTVAYKITDSLTYKAFAAYADFDVDTLDPDASFMIGHRLRLDF